MKKELEINYTDKDIDTTIIWIDGINLTKRAILNAVEYYWQNNTPPTADEVCEELNKWYSDVVDYVFIHGVDDFTYDEKNKRFYKRMLNSPHEMTICRIDTNGCMELREPLPPHLITLIGRFYEVQE